MAIGKLIAQEKRNKEIKNFKLWTLRNLHQGPQPQLRQRILYDASQQPVVMPSVPDLISLLGDCGCPLLILPEGVQL